MPQGVHKKQARTYRPESADLYERAKAAVAAVGSDMNSHLNDFLRWLTHETDELPPRPPKPTS
jgi:hypothetical protein